MKKNLLKVIVFLVVTVVIFTGCTSEKSISKEKESFDKVRYEEYFEGENSIIVDSRDDEEYNGWVIDEDIPQGHIKGAISFSEKWLKDLSKEEAINLLSDSGISKNNKVMIYSNYGEESISFLEKLNELGYEDAINVSLKDISNDKDLMKKIDFEYMEKYHMFVYPKWVKDLLDGKNPDNYDGRDYIIIDTNYDYFEKYKKGHIPKAIYVDTCEIECAPLWNLVSPETFKTLFKNTGITKDTLVIFTSDEPMASGRVAAAFMYAGVEDVRILNGGNHAWKDAGFKLETGENKWVKGENFGAEIPVHPEYNIDIEEAKKLLNNPNGRLVAAVSWDEYTGANNGGYSYFDEKGRIPGSVFGYGGVDAYHSEDYLDDDFTMRSYKEMEKIWGEWDIKPENESAFFCATGWRGGLAFFEAYAMGWEDISVFDGGFYEWSRNPENPIAVGDPRIEYDNDRKNSELKFLDSVGNH